MNTAASNRRQSRRGLTLVELLTVSAILIVLAGLLLPALSKVGKTRDGTKCVSNLKQLGVAALLYVQEHDGALPGLGPTNPTLYMAQGWRPTFGGYMGEPKGTYLPVFLCPAASQDPDIKPNWKTAITMQNSYAINQKFLLRKLAAVGRPSQKALITDVYDGYLSPAESMFSYDVWRVSRRHPNESTNVLWIDGHVSPMQTALLHDVQYTNPD